MPRILSSALKCFSPPCFVALGLLVMALAFFGGSALSEPLAAPQSAPALAPTVLPPEEAVTQDWDNLGLYGAQVSSAAIDPSSNPPTGRVYVGTTSGSGLYRSAEAETEWEMDDNPSKSSPIILRRQEHSLSRHG